MSRGLITTLIQPLLWAASADYGGRKTVYIVSLGIFNIANVLLAALPPNIGALFVLRVLQAIGSCAVTSVGAGTVADITEPRLRASALSVFLLGPQVGPIIGPIIGGQFAVPGRWRWIFGFLGTWNTSCRCWRAAEQYDSTNHVAAMACLPVYCLIIFCLPETLRSLVGNGDVHAGSGWINKPRLRQPPLVDNRRFPRVPRPSPKLYIKLLKFPPNLIVTINGALMFAAFYAMLINFPYALQDVYGFSEAQVGYAYFFPGRLRNAPESSRIRNIY
jgi:MFS family permease